MRERLSPQAAHAVASEPAQLPRAINVQAFSLVRVPPPANQCAPSRPAPQALANRVEGLWLVQSCVPRHSGSWKPIWWRWRSVVVGGLLPSLPAPPPPARHLLSNWSQST